MCFADSELQTGPLVRRMMCTTFPARKQPHRQQQLLLLSTNSIVAACLFKVLVLTSRCKLRASNISHPTVFTLFRGHDDPDGEFYCMCLRRHSRHPPIHEINPPPSRKLAPAASLMCHAHRSLSKVFVPICTSLRPPQQKLWSKKSSQSPFSPFAWGLSAKKGSAASSVRILTGAQSVSGKEWLHSLKSIGHLEASLN